MGQSLPRRPGKATVLVCLHGSHAGWPRILHRFRERGWRLLDPRYGGGVDVLDRFAVQGAIVDELPDSPLVRRLRRLRCPVVRMGSLPHPLDARVPALVPDLARAGGMAAEHFFERGFKHVGYVGFDPWSDKRALYEGLDARATALGCTCHLLRWKSEEGGSTWESKYRHRQPLLAEWLRSIPRPVGLLGFVDGFAATLCCMCQDSGLAVPEDVAVMGYGNILPTSEGSVPTLSSIVPDDPGLADAAVDVLGQLMQGRTLPQTTVRIAPLSIVTRESTDTLAVSNRHVAMALRYLWNHLALDLSVEQIAQAVGVSCRTLERDFRGGLGRGIVAELRRKRLEQLKLLLRTTDTKIADLAPQVGFRSSQYLHRAFRAAFGQTPRRYRAANRVQDD